MKMLRLSLAAVSLAAWLAAPASGQDPGDTLRQVPAESADSVKQRNPQAGLEMELHSSRPHHSAGSVVAITATLTNHSSRTIYLTQRSVSLMQPPELESSGRLRAWPAFFPSEEQPVARDVPDGRHRDASTDSLHASVVLALAPGVSTEIGWSPSDINRSSSGGWIREAVAHMGEELRFIFFTPGDYPISVQAKYWTDSLRAGPYSIQSRTMPVHVSAPQLVIILGAAIGGLVAYFLVPSRRPQEVVVERRPGERMSFRHDLIVWRKHIPLALGAMLWSAIVTVLLARLGETQFLVRVTVADFWGAVAIGVVAHYAGSRWLERLIPPAEQQRDAPTGGDAGPRPKGPAMLPQPAGGD